MIVPLVVSVLQFISALFIDKDIDGDASKLNDMGLSKRFRFVIKSIG